MQETDKSSKIIQIQMYVQLDKKLFISSTRSLNIAVVRPTTGKVPNCRFGVIK
jgi:hypothetical protein